MMKPPSHTWPLVSINRLTPFRNSKMVLFLKKKKTKLGSSFVLYQCRSKSFRL